MIRLNSSRTLSSALWILLMLCATAAAQEKIFPLDAKQTTVHFTLGSALHTVHGNFVLKLGSLRADPSTGAMSGEIIVDARSGESGNGLRDRKMHREILESDKYPEIVFRPTHMEGALADEGTSKVQVHGIFSLHGAAHEITIPADVTLAPGRWTASLTFHIPYVKWGLKNPSTLFLRADESVEIEVAAVGGYEQKQ